MSAPKSRRFLDVAIDRLGDIPVLPTVEEAIAWANDLIDKIAAS